MNIIKKIDGNIKGRTCDNSSKHKQYFIEGGYISSTTVSLEVLVSTLLFNVYDE